MDKDIREKYKALKARANDLYKAAEPEREALRIAESPYWKMRNLYEELIDGTEVDDCESCGEPIFDDDKRHSGGDVVLCESCAPTYGDMLASPSHFVGIDEAPMTADEARRVCDAHVADGGSLDDKLVR